MKMYGYLRVSSKQQLLGGGLDRQRGSVESFVGENGHVLVDVFKEEGVSGATSVKDRPSFVRMMSEISRSGVKDVVVERLDRVARQYVVQEQIVVYLASKGVNLWVSSTGENVTEAVTSDPMKKAMIQMQGIFAELERSMIISRMNDGRARVIAEKGKCGGAKSWDEGNPEKKKQVILFYKAMNRKPRVRGKKPTFGRIAARLNDEGWTTLRNKPWSAQTLACFVKKYC